MGGTAPDDILADAERRLAAEDPAEALVAFERWAVVFEDPDDPRAIALEIARCHALRECGRLEEARERGNRAVAAARRAGHALLLGRALAAVAEALYRSSEPRAAEALARRALVEAQGDPTSLTAARVVLAQIQRDRGMHEDALRTATAAVEAGGTGRCAVLAVMVAAEGLRVQGDVAGGRALAEDLLARTPQDAKIDRALLLQELATGTLANGDARGALAEVERVALLLGTVRAQTSGSAANLRGEILRTLGDLAGAAAAYREAVDVLAHVRSDRRWTSQLNLVLTSLTQGDVGTAARLLDEVFEADEIRDQTAVGTYAELLGAAVAASRGDVRAWGRHHERAAGRLQTTERTHPDLALALRLAGRAWSGSSDRGSRSRAYRARSLALAQWQRLGVSEDAEHELRELRTLAKAGVPVPAGPFDLLEELGRGAMGEVWRARHHVRGTDVAVKLLRTDATHDDVVRQSFDAEIRNVAALEHPGIVRILGHGVLDPSAGLAGGPHHGGAPWYAMELVTGGTMRTVCGRLRWSQCRGVLTGLLDALAHAHARDVLHLDIKPANVLVDSAETLRVRLADFGLFGLVGSLEAAVGTPQYMAPEQFRAQVRDFGPWTDLYALGCLAWHLLAGRPPFDGEDPASLRIAHMGASLPPFRPVVPVPDGFEAWLYRLLDKDRLLRYENAADAAWALCQLEDPADDPAPIDAMAMPSMQAAPVTFSIPTWDSLDSEDLVSPVTGPVVSERPPMPVRWRSPAPPRPAGMQALDLFGLRRIPLVGRQRERSILWATLADVVRRQRPRLLAIEGPSGSGRTALARWLVETARERGVARVATARSGPDAPGPAELVVQWFHTRDLSEEVVRRRIEHLSPPGLSIADLASLAAIALGRIDPAEVVGATAHLLTALAALRPVVLWLEGEPVHDPEAMALARELVSGTAPVLVLLEATPGQDRESDRRYEDLLDLPPTMAVALDPLTADEVRELVLELLPLDLETVDPLVQRAGGDLQLAVALLEDLVARDALLEGPRGLVLRTGARLAPPARLEQGWAERIDRALDGLPAAARDVLGACAVAHGEVPADAWRTLCEAAGISSPSQLIRQLRTHRLVSPTPSRGWSFAHRGIASLLRDQAAADGRLPRLSALAAAHLPFPDAARLGTVLLDAGEAGRALDPLVQGLRDALERHDPTAASALCDALDDALRALGVSESDPRWIAALLGRARLADVRGDRDEALRLSARAIELCDGPERVRERFDALWVQARTQAGHGLGAAAAGTLKLALAAAREVGDPRLVARVRLAVANAARLRGDVEGAERHYQRGLRELGEVDDATRAPLTMGLGLVRAARGELDAAAATLRRALAGLDAAGEQQEAADCRAALGRVAVQRGRADEAEGWFDAALGQILHADRARRADVRLDRCLVWAEAGRWDEVGAQVREVLDGMPDLAVEPRAWACTLLAAVQAASPDGAFSATLDTLDALLRQSGVCRAEIARMLETAAERACDPGRTRRCFELAAAQWRTLGDRDAARRARDAARSFT